MTPDGESKLSKHKHVSRLSQNRSNNKQQKSSKQRKTSGSTTEVQINVNGENMLVTLENLERTIPKPPKKSGISKQRQKQEMIAQAKQRAQ